MLAVIGHKKVLQSKETKFLQQKIQLRSPYVTPLNIMQVSPALYEACATLPEPVARSFFSYQRIDGVAVSRGPQKATHKLPFEQGCVHSSV